MQVGAECPTVVCALVLSRYINTNVWVMRNQGRPDVGNTDDMKPGAQTGSQTQNSLINVVGLGASIFVEVMRVERQRVRMCGNESIRSAYT